MSLQNQSALDVVARYHETEAVKNAQTTSINLISTNNSSRSSIFVQQKNLRMIYSQKKS